MPTIPRITIDDATLEEPACAICGEEALRIAHVDKLPDFISCGNCGSVFVMEEGGDRVMYGKIPPEYPKTSALALRQWLMKEVVEAQATAERPRPSPARAEQAAGLPFEPRAKASGPPWASDEPPSGEPISGLDQEERWAGDQREDREEPASRFQALLRSYEQAPPAPGGADEAGSRAEGATPGSPWADLAEEFEIPEPDALRPTTAPPVVRRPAAGTAEAEPLAAKPIPQDMPAPPKEQAVGAGAEPPPGSRYQVRIKGYRVRVPKSSCAHCLRIPASRTLSVLAPAPPGSQRRVVRLNAPLCYECFHRANARSAEESAARLQAHLISALVAMLLVVLALGVRLVNLQESPGIGLLVLLILGVVGYGVPAFFLLGRSSRFPPPADALYVRSTLIVLPEAEPAGLTFSWRNPGFADLFFETNNKAAAGLVVQVADQPASNEPPS